MSTKLSELEEAISRHGNALHVAWLESRYTFYRHEKGLVGFIVSNGFAISWSDPLASTQTFEEILEGFVEYCKENGLSPLWLNATKVFMQILLARNWTILQCSKEDVVDPMTYNTSAKVRRKSSKARLSCSVRRYQTLPCQSIVDEVQRCVDRWQEGRKGLQLFSATARPFLCAESRQWFVATEAESGAVVGVVTLHKLPAKYGWAIDHSITAPTAPKGTSEMTLDEVFTDLRADKCQYVTFGGSATPTLTAVNNLWGVKFKCIAIAFEHILARFGLTNRSTFRSKFGCQKEPLFACFPPNTINFGTIVAILHTLVHDQSTSGQ